MEIRNSHTSLPLLVVLFFSACGQKEIGVEQMKSDTLKFSSSVVLRRTMQELPEFLDSFQDHWQFCKAMFPDDQANQILCIKDPLEQACEMLRNCEGDINTGDTDGDGKCNDLDTDDDGDGWSDVDEIDCDSNPLLSSSVPADINEDGTCDAIQFLETKLTASDAVDHNFFGNSVAINGEVAIIGAYGQYWGGPDSGAAYIFRLVNGEWIQKKKFVSSDEQASDEFGSSVAISGDVAIVGARGEDGRDGDTMESVGAAYIFQLVNGEWAEMQKLTASVAQNRAWFGESVAINGEVAIIGAYGEDGSGADAGAAYIFQLVNGEWVKKQRLTTSDAQANDDFGNSVSISGDVAIVGARKEDGEIGDPDSWYDGPGAAYIFQLVNGEWVEMQKLTASDAQVYDYFGVSVSISGNVAIVGARSEDGGVGDLINEAGAAYIFQLVNGEWIEMQKLTASDAQGYDHFGNSVSISGEVAIIGAHGEDGGDGDPMATAGAAYIFQLVNGEWVEIQKLTASDAQVSDFFGWSVSINGGFAIVGSDGEDGGNGDPIDDAGATYIFRLRV